MSDTLFDLAQHYHAQLTDRIRQYLHGRGLTDTVIDRYLLGWSGWRITIPITNRDGEVAFFKLAKDPEDNADTPKMLTAPGGTAELYGWEQVQVRPERLVICEGEFDRLVFESRGIPAVTSTAGAGTFRLEWADALRDIPQLFVCFDRDAAGETGANRLARLLPQALLVRLPDEVGEGGDVTDFFVRLGHSVEEFDVLLDTAQPARAYSDRSSSRATPTAAAGVWPRDEIVGLKQRVHLEDVVAHYVRLQPVGRSLIGRCPFHDDHHPSFVVYPATQGFHCFGCGAHGDVLAFLMLVESLRFPEAVDALRRLAA